ncbi:MAG: YlxR family protein [Anaerolineales bacterium]
MPQRTCVGCREVLPKRELIRIVRSPDGVVIDPKGKISGRGAYLHDRRSCWERGLKSALANALKIELTDEDREKLLVFMASLREGEPAQDIKKL